MDKTKNPVYMLYSIARFKEYGEERFRNWCNSIISHTKNKAETERLITLIKAEIKNEEEK